MKVTAKKSSIGLLAKGFHVGIIKSIVETTIASADQKEGAYADETPQLEITLGVGNQTTKAWLMLKGYHKFEEFVKELTPKHAAKYRPGGSSGYAVLIATNTRVEDEALTEKCMEIVGNFAANAGAEDGEDIDIQDLVGSEIGFKIGEGNKGQNRDVGFYDKDYALSQIEKAEEAAEDLED